MCVSAKETTGPATIVGDRHDREPFKFVSIPLLLLLILFGVVLLLSPIYLICCCYLLPL